MHATTVGRFHVCRTGHSESFNPDNSYANLNINFTIYKECTRVYNIFQNKNLGVFVKLFLSQNTDLSYGLRKYSIFKIKSLS